MVSKKLPYDTNGLPYDVYMGDSRPQCNTVNIFNNNAPIGTSFISYKL